MGKIVRTSFRGFLACVRRFFLQPKSNVIKSVHSPRSSEATLGTNGRWLGIRKRKQAARPHSQKSS